MCMFLSLCVNITFAAVGNTTGICRKKFNVQFQHLCSLFTVPSHSVTFLLLFLSCFLLFSFLKKGSGIFYSAWLCSISFTIPKFPSDILSCTNYHQKLCYQNSHACSIFCLPSVKWKLKLQSTIYTLVYPWCGGGGGFEAIK